MIIRLDVNRLILIFTLSMFSSFVFQAHSQNVAINTTGNSAHPSALLEVGSGNPNTGGDTRGILFPRVALTSQTDATTIPSPSKSLLVWNTGSGGLTPEGFFYWDGTKWERLSTGTGGGGGSGTSKRNANCYTCDGF